MNDLVLFEPWKNEPDEERGESHGFPTAIIRHNELGHLCGYVGVPSNHPKAFLSYEDLHADVHGGLTYGRDRLPCEQPDGYSWYGFDCAHVGDYIPNLAFRSPLLAGSETYRDIAYVRAEIEKLAAFFAATWKE